MVRGFRRDSEFFLSVKMGVKEDLWMRTNAHEDPKREEFVKLKTVLRVNIIFMILYLVIGFLCLQKPVVTKWK